MPGRRLRFVRIVLPLWLLGTSVGAASLPEGAAVIALDADSGEILRLDHPPAATAAHPPGSLIKVFTALLACEDGGIDPASRYSCRGETTIDGRRHSCWLKGGHGPVNLAKALALSCNLYFLDLAGRLDPGRLREFLAQAGLGRNTGSDLPGEEDGCLPSGWTREEAALAGAGMSSRIQVTPCQMAAGFAALINGGWIPTPHQATGGPGQRRPFSTPAALNRVRQALREGSAYGTTRGFQAATGGFAKTGTAAWEEGYHTSAWTAACFEARGRKVSLVVYLPEGQGGRDALPLATEIAREMQALPPTSTASPWVSVSLFSLLAPKELIVSAPAGGVGFDGGTDSRPCPSLSVRVAPGGQLRVVTRDGPLPEPPPSLRLTGSSGELVLDVPGLPPRRISGEVEVRSENGVLFIVNRLPLEEYVAGTVEGEMGANPTALACQAIAARSYAWVNRGRHHDQGVDFCDTTHCQFYSGIPRQEATRTAVARTAGLILTRAGVPVEVYFHSTCGGHTAAAGTTFGEQTPPHLSGVSDGDDCQSSPHAHWRWQVDAETLLAAIRELYGPDITGWEVGASDPAGRVLDIRLVSERGAPVEVRAEDWRMAMTRRFGWQTLKSTLFAVHREGPDWVFRGRGLGHGVGLCQWGAFGMARRGESMEAILAHYFPGTEVSRWDRLPRQGTPDDDPEAILARALARIGTEWEAPPLDRPTIRVAASTAEFSRRSGARPFAAGRYLRGTIHLQPLDLLRRRGILERTIVHEAAHFCLERLAGPACPRWLAEGLAGRMAGTDEGTDEAEGSPPAVAEIDRGLRSPFWTEAETAARQATVLVGRLIDTAGMPRLIATLRAQRRGDPGPLQELARAAGLSGF